MDFNNTSIRNAGDYFNPGKFTAELVLAKEIQAGAKKESRIVFEFKVLASTNAEDIGRKKSIVINPNDKFDYGPKDIKTILVALEGLQATDEAGMKRVDWNKKFADAIEPSKNGYKGRVVELEVWIPEGKKYSKWTMVPASGAPVASSLAEVTVPDLDDAPGLPGVDPLEAALADGWKQHPKSDKHLFKGTTVKLRDEVLAGY